MERLYAFLFKNHIRITSRNCEQPPQIMGVVCLFSIRFFNGQINIVIWQELN